MSSSKRIEKMRLDYIRSKPSISTERAALWTQSHRQTEGEAVCIRRAKALLHTCRHIKTPIFEGELIVGSCGETTRSGILTPEFSWNWVDREMDSFEDRPQDPYIITKEDKQLLRGEIFPYWQGLSLEDHFLSRIPEETARILIDTGVIDNDSKWRQAVGEITPDYQDVLFPKGYLGIRAEAEAKLAQLRPLSEEEIDKIDFYHSILLSCDAIMALAERYSFEALRLSEIERDALRKRELQQIAEICRRVPSHPPATFREAIQFVWFVQLGGILSENPLALNLGRFDQYLHPFYLRDKENGILDDEQALELIEALWIKLSQWVWTISGNTAAFFAGYNQFQNLTVGGRKRNGESAVNELSYLCLQATESVRTHQPGLSVRLHPDSPEEFYHAIARLVGSGTGFPAIHSDTAGSQMLMQAGYEPEDARDWSNCGCVVPHFRKTGQWTAAVNLNMGSALEFTLNEGKSFLSPSIFVPCNKKISDFQSFDEVMQEYKNQLSYLIEHSVIATILAQKIHAEIVPRPFLSTTVDGCMEKGKDLSKGGALYNVGPVLTGIGLALVANSLFVIKKLVFEEKELSLGQLRQALAADWEGYEDLRKRCLQMPKYGNDIEEVDLLAVEISDFYYRKIRSYRDLFGSPFNSAFMGISNYIPAGKIVGATPCGRKARQPLTEGVSPFTGSDISSPLAAMRSAAKINHDVHTGGTLLNLRLAKSMLCDTKGYNNLSAMLRSYFSLGAFHVQFNCVDTALLRKAQKSPDQYRDLLVRVAGYSAQFVNLSAEMQEAIIARSEHSF